MSNFDVIFAGRYYVLGVAFGSAEAQTHSNITIQAMVMLRGQDIFNDKAIFTPVQASPVKSSSV